MLAWGLIALFFALPLVPVGGRPAVLLDLAARQFHVLGATFHPTDNLLLAALGVAVIITVFFVGSTFGRLWCGYACPQTVYMEFLFRPDRDLARGPAGAAGAAEPRALGPAEAGDQGRLKWALWAAVALAMSATFVAYFVGWERPRAPGARPAGGQRRPSLGVVAFVAARHPLRLRLVPRPDVHAGLPLRPPAERDGRPRHRPGGLRREAGRAAGRSRRTGARRALTATASTAGCA